MTLREQYEQETWKPWFRQFSVTEIVPTYEYAAWLERRADECMMPLNLNDKVRVRLTDIGREIHRRQFDEFKQRFPAFGYDYSPPKEDADGWSEWQLWDLMGTFGNYISLGCNVPFETTILVLEL